MQNLVFLFFFIELYILINAFLLKRGRRDGRPRAARRGHRSETYGDVTTAEGHQGPQLLKEQQGSFLEPLEGVVFTRPGLRNSGLQDCRTTHSCWSCYPVLCSGILRNLTQDSPRIPRALRSSPLSPVFPVLGSNSPRWVLLSPAAGLCRVKQLAPAVACGVASPPLKSAQEPPLSSSPTTVPTGWKERGHFFRENA